MAEWPGKVYFIGAGPGDPELLTLKARRIIEEADLVIYADSLVSRAVCDFARPDAEIRKSAALTLEELVEIMATAVQQGKTVARLHTGDPSIFSAALEQMAALEERGIEYEVVPGVSSVFAAAASLGAELTVPEVSQTVIITRVEGRTPMPPKQDLRSLAQHDATMVFFLSVPMIDRVVAELLAGGYPATTPVAVVHRASWEDESSVVGTLADITAKVRDAGIGRQALILVGRVLNCKKENVPVQRSRLYDPSFGHGYRTRVTFNTEAPRHGEREGGCDAGTAG
ncbi:MAG: precorrin-4 C(11)-methyltransferase [Chloroflexi bacterium]|nr:precorrin-4 C(11)-methyltransferase [Chloroflexota bacterium]